MWGPKKGVKYARLMSVGVAVNKSLSSRPYNEVPSSGLAMAVLTIESENRC